MKVFVLNGRKAAYTLFGVFCFCVLVYVGFLPEVESVVASADITQTTYVAIVVEGFGSGFSGTKEFLYMSTPYIGVVSPDKPYANEEIRFLAEGQRDVFIHVGDELKKDFNNINGISIHGSSEFMQDERVALELMTFAKDNNLIVIDTNPKNKQTIKEISEDLGVIYFEKDIALDNEKDISKIEKKLKKAANLSDKNGYAIVVADLSKNTGKSVAQAIKNISGIFEERNIKFVTITELVEILGY